jgi:mRNA-degrading endonuclease RelE of RelBE toxin-antitoxin system
MKRALVLSKPFVRDYRDLPKEIQQEVDKALRLLLDNPRHPSLQVKKMQPKSEGIFEVRVTQAYRLTFHLEKGHLFLRRRRQARHSAHTVTLYAPLLADDRDPAGSRRAEVDDGDPAGSRGSEADERDLHGRHAEPRPPSRQSVLE